MKTKILNYTLHDISIITNKGVIQIPRHGTARCSTTRKLIEYLEVEGTRVPVNKTVFGVIAGLPEETEGTILIVSAIAANSLRKTRNDIYVVDEPVRSNGIIVGCKALAKIVEY